MKKIREIRSGMVSLAGQMARRQNMLSDNPADIAAMMPNTSQRTRSRMQQAATMADEQSRRWAVELADLEKALGEIECQEVENAR